MGGKAVNPVLPNGLLFSLGDGHLILAQVRYGRVDGYDTQKE